jgi:spore coat polysaccharide biosynthesis predicted glycosyltransferase SpsG
MRKIVLRADGGKEIGFGHIMRCSRLAELLDEQNCKCIFVTCGEKDAEDYLKRMGFVDVHSVNKEDVLKAVLAIEPDMVINDVRNTDLEYMRALGAAGIKTVNFDDVGEGSALADAVVDANIKPDGTEDDSQYFGADYVALDPQFTHYHGLEKEIVEYGRKILILMGGSDPGELTHKVLGALSQVAIRFEITVVVGPGNKRFFDNYDGYNSEGVRVLQEVSCLGRLMHEADIGISSGGLTMYEMAATGTPDIVLSQAPHELDNAKIMEDGGVIANLGMGSEALEGWITNEVETLAGDTARRRKMSENGKKHVDARGIDRVITLISDLLEESECLAV